MTPEEKKWKAEEDLRTLRRADEIKSDKGRVRAAQKIAKAEVKALTNIAGRGGSGKAARKR